MAKTFCQSRLKTAAVLVVDPAFVGKRLRRDLHPLRTRLANQAQEFIDTAHGTGLHVADMHRRAGFPGVANDFEQARGIAGNTAADVHDHRRLACRGDIEYDPHFRIVDHLAHVVQQHADAQPAVVEALFEVLP